MSHPLLEHDHIIANEMFSHPALFMHAAPQQVAILSNDQGILQEVVKHTDLAQIFQITQNKITENANDTRVQFLNKMDPFIKTEALDILIVTEVTPDQTLLSQFSSMLHKDGILILQSESPFQISRLKAAYQGLYTAGFADVLTVQFPQPSFPSGWRTALMAVRQGNFKRIREKDVFNKSFSTRYYNYDVHKAALVLPEFMREELIV